MNTKIAFLSVFIVLNLNINFCLGQNNADSSYTENVDTSANIVKKKKLFKKNENDKSKQVLKYQLSEEEIRLRNAHPDSLSKRELKKLKKSYKKEQKFNKKNGIQDEGGLDPITRALFMKNPEYEGMNLTENDIRTLSRINKKYGITQDDLNLRAGNIDTLNLIQRFKIAKTYRKEYLLKKNLDQFWKKKIFSMQPPDAQRRMKEHEKRIKRRDRHRIWAMRKKKFLNLFK